MKSLAPLCATMGLALFVTSCVSYSGVTRTPDGELYISGATNYFIISLPWVRRCQVDGTTLKCVELTESPPPAAGAAGGTASPASSAEPSSSATDAPAPDASATPADKK